MFNRVTPLIALQLLVSDFSSFLFLLIIPFTLFIDEKS